MEEKGGGGEERKKEQRKKRIKRKKQRKKENDNNNNNTVSNEPRIKQTEFLACKNSLKSILPEPSSSKVRKTCSQNGPALPSGNSVEQMDRNLRRLSSPLGQSFCTNATKIFLPFVYRRRALVVMRGLCNGRMSVRSSLCLSVPSMEFFWFGTRCNLNKMSREHLCHSLSVRPSSHVPPLYATMAFYWTVNYP